MNTKLKLLLPVLLWLGFSLAIQPTAFASNESEVRAAVERIFNELKSGQYEKLYDTLPSSSRARISRDRFLTALRNTRNLYQLDRIEIGTPRISRDLAVVDTTMYAHIYKPFDADGKMLVQQYLIREDGAWRVATGDNATINRFLKNNPEFARKFPIKPLRAFINQNGKWTEVPLGSRRS
jgi:hypothetical protein